MIDFSIDPVHFYITYRGKDIRHTEDFNAINKLTLQKRKSELFRYHVSLWSDVKQDYIDCTDEFATINEKLGY